MPVLTDAEIQKLKREALRPNYGSRYCTLEQMLAVIETYERMRDQLKALQEPKLFDSGRVEADAAESAGGRENQ